DRTAVGVAYVGDGDVAAGGVDRAVDVLAEGHQARRHVNGGERIRRIDDAGCHVVPTGERAAEVGDGRDLSSGGGHELPGCLRIGRRAPGGGVSSGDHGGGAFGGGHVPVELDQRRSVGIEREDLSIHPASAARR